MDLEVQFAVNFLIGYLVNKLPRRRVQLFHEELVKRLTKKFEGHWYPEKPCKGSGYRCLLITDSLDPVLSSAAKESGLNVKDVKANLPEKLCLWIDPQEVSFRIGEFNDDLKDVYKVVLCSKAISFSVVSRQYFLCFFRFAVFLVIRECPESDRSNDTAE